MSSKIVTYECSECSKSEVWMRADVYEYRSEIGQMEAVNFPEFKTCEVCKGLFCDACHDEHNCLRRVA